MRITDSELGAALRRLRDRDVCRDRRLCGGICWADGLEQMDVHCQSSAMYIILGEARRAKEKP